MYTEIAIIPVILYEYIEKQANKHIFSTQKWFNLTRACGGAIITLVVSSAWIKKDSAPRRVPAEDSFYNLVEKVN